MKRTTGSLLIALSVVGMATTDRAVKVVRYMRMKTLLILFGGVQVLTAWVLAMLGASLFGGQCPGPLVS